MSGQPNISPTDASKFREAYMSNLNLQIAIDDKNLQANKVYNRTGQLPVQPSDFRTIEEKLADVLTLRTDVRMQLGTIADGATANSISQQLSPPELVFYYQQSPLINQLIKERFSKGVNADIFIGYLRKYMVDSAANKGVASGLQQVSGKNLLLNAENIARILATEPDYNGLLDAYIGTGINIKPYIQEAISVLPKPDLFIQINSIDDENIKFMLLEETNNYLKDLPTQGQIASKIREVERLKNSRDLIDLRAETERIISLITPSEDTKVQMMNVMIALGGTAPPDLMATTVIGAPPVKATLVIDANDLIMDIKTFDDILKLNNAERKEVLGVINSKYPIFGTKRAIPIDIGRFKSKGGKSQIEFLQELTPANQELLMKKVKLMKDEISVMPSTKMGSGLSMSGCGVVVKSKPKRYDTITKDDIDYTAGITKPVRFIPLGRYVINRHRLNDNVVSVKRPSGAGINEFPSQRVSNHLGNVLRSIIGNGIPSYDDLEELDDEEKSYLHKLAKQSQIIDRISIPTPKKSDADKDLNRFEILKGQILSGNDNKELIKEFKILLMKLGNNKILPKPQVREMLFDLTSMGF